MIRHVARHIVRHYHRAHHHAVAVTIVCVVSGAAVVGISRDIITGGWPSVPSRGSSFIENDSPRRSIPEPTSLALVAPALAVLLWLRRRR
jgi:hypothetical protein